MATRIRYTDAEKREFVEKIKALKQKGLTENAIADELGISVNSVRKWQGKDGGVKVKTRRTAKSKLTPKTKTKATTKAVKDPVAAMMANKERLDAIDAEIERLENQKASLQTEIKQVYEQVGKELFG